jgi:nitrate/nitrite transporter NarK
MTAQCRNLRFRFLVADHRSENIGTVCHLFDRALGFAFLGRNRFSVAWVGRSSDHHGERKLHTAVPMGLAAFFFTLSALAGTPFPVAMLWLCATGAVLFAWAPSFWVLPTLALGESAAAASFGLINLVGNLGGFVGPSMVGYLLSSNRSHTATTGFLAASFVIGAAMILAVRTRRIGV